MESPSGVKASVHISPEGTFDAGCDIFRAKDPVTVVIFGASGDLSKRKLIPALYHLQEMGFLPNRYAVLGFSRTEMTDEAYRGSMFKALQQQVKDGENKVQPDNALVRSLYYQPGNINDIESFKKLKEKLDGIDKEHNLPGNRLFYLSVAPEFFAQILKNLCAAGLICGMDDQVWSHVIIEKPFGRDLESARQLNADVTAILDESQIYRIDHYLGKETVQNILTFRFGNSIFEPLFNQKYVDNVQITVAETLGMEGRRGTFYETAGAMRDIVQNHMLQLLCLTAMEPPSALEPQSIRDEKVKVLRALLPLNRKEVAAWTVRGQYGIGEVGDQTIKSYRQEEGVDPKSTTETFVALRMRIDNWRWAGVPFFLRTGKRLRRRVTEIAVEFKQPPLYLFSQLVQEGDFPPLKPMANVLVLRIQPDEGISLSFACKRPGIGIQLAEVNMDFFYELTFQQRTPDAYERLLLDALRGDPSLFTRSDEVDYAWRFSTSVLEGWANLPPQKFPNYYAYTDGPVEASRLMEGTRAEWRPLSQM
ncbi:MAG: glucose-6-phosphate dehydrogenase [Candidatus Binatia bacterium]|nr:glucose-6-phosphate dehydrogenase [Candidatus Binatia bacterium]